MGVLLESLVVPAITILTVAVALVIAYLKFVAFTYWEKRRVPFSPPSIFGGNVGSILVGKESMGKRMEALYNEFKSKGHKHGGIYFLNSPIYMPLDPDTIKNMLIKDFQHFVDRGVYFNEEAEPLTAHLFAIEGLKWKNLRAKLSPTFTSGKMKMMFEILAENSHNLNNICTEYAENKKSIDIKDIMARFTTDIIGSCAFGLECNSLKYPDDEFRKMGKDFFDLSVYEAMKNFMSLGTPRLTKFLNLRVMKKHVADFFMKVLYDTIQYRESKNITRNDFLQLLIQLKNNNSLDNDEQSVGKTLTFNELAAQAFVFYLAGFETSSTTMTFCLFELAQHQDIQSKLREEILTVLKETNGKLSYDAVMKMTYMDKVINEALRKYPPVPMLNRICTSESYKVPETNLTLEKGTAVLISVLGIQKDPEYYPDPEKFDPERFSEKNKANRHSALFLPFGDGPRNCIGLRFGLMQAKVGLATVLRNFVFTLSPETKTELKFATNSFILTSVDDIMLDLKRYEP